MRKVHQSLKYLLLELILMKLLAKNEKENISEKEHVYDVNFLQLIEAMNNDKKHEIFSKNMTVKYCGYSKNQLQKLIQKTNYAFNSKMKIKQHMGYYITKIEYVNKKPEIKKLF